MSNFTFRVGLAFKFLLELLLLISTIQSYYIRTGNHKNLTINSFAFGSCFYGKFSNKLDIFKSVHKENPDLWMWLGDAAYIDELVLFGYYKSTINFDPIFAKKMFFESKNNECKIINL